MSSKPEDRNPNASPCAREEFEELLKQCEHLRDLSRMEDTIEKGLRRIGRSLAQETVQREADRQAASGAAFSPGGNANRG